MAYCYDNLKLEKGMYHEAGRSFTQVLESRDPSEQYRGTALEGLDAFQRQLKRFDIKVKGTGSDVVEKVLPHCRLRRAVPGVYRPLGAPGYGGDGPAAPAHRRGDTVRRHGLPLHHLRGGRRGERAAPSRRGTEIPSTTVKVQENLVKLNKRGRMLVASYEAVRCQKLDLFSVTLRQIGAHISRMHLEDAIQVLMEGMGTATPPRWTARQRRTR